jgi:hypothetical protein
MAPKPIVDGLYEAVEKLGVWAISEAGAPPVWLNAGERFRLSGYRGEYPENTQALRKSGDPGELCCVRAYGSRHSSKLYVALRESLNTRVTPVAL